MSSINEILLPVLHLRESKVAELLSEAKADELEGRKARKNPSVRLVHRLMQAIEAPVAPARLTVGAGRS